MMPDHPHILMEFDNRVIIREIHDDQLINELLMVKKGEVVEISFPGDTNLRYYILDDVENYVFTRGYYRFKMIQAKEKI